MATTSSRQLLLLADHLKLSLLERQRAVSLNLDATKEDAQITRSLAQLHEGLATLETQDDQPDDVTRIRAQYDSLHRQFYASSTTAEAAEEIRIPNDPALAEDFVTAQKAPSAARNKNTRFRDDPSAPAVVAYKDNEDDAANRAALFSDSQDRYRDEELPTDHSQLDNQQIHAHHTQVLRDQDEQLDVLGASIGRQRLLGIQMGNELDEQNELLDDVERGVDRHTTTLERARKRLGDVARKSKANGSWITIGILIIILILVIAILK